jgi:hypothetical protein
MKSSCLALLSICLAQLPSALGSPGPGALGEAQEPQWHRHSTKYGHRCVVPANDDGTDDSPAIIEAFKKCRNNSVIVFKNTTYNIERAIAVKDLHNVKVDIKGTLLVRSYLTSCYIFLADWSSGARTFSTGSPTPSPSAPGSTRSRTLRPHTRIRRLP